MDFERALETQRLKLLRLVAGLVVLVGVLSLGPISRGFSITVCRFVGAMLSRAETAAQYLVIAQARLMDSRSGMAIGQSQFSESLARAFPAEEKDVSLSDCRERLKALLAVLTHLPRHAARLIRRIEKQMRDSARTYPLSPHSDECLSGVLDGLRLVGPRIERPPDKGLLVSSFFHLPPNSGREAQAVGRWCRQGRCPIAIEADLYHHHDPVFPSSRWSFTYSGSGHASWSIPVIEPGFDPRYA